MRLDTRALAAAAGAAAVIGFVICAVFVAVAPGATSAFFSYVLHLDFTSLARPLTWASFAGGVVVIPSAVAIFAALVGSMYNRLAPSGSAHGPAKPDR